jgi:hypothetical protein
MTVRALYKINEKAVDAMDLTIAFTMTVSEWRRIMEICARTGYEGGQVESTIMTALGDIRRLASRDYSYPVGPNAEPD